ncbi:MAG: hypothetical protein RLO21_00820 [Nitratireductor sp.]
MTDPIGKRYRKKMNRVANQLDEAFNSSTRGHARKTGFALLVFDMDMIEGGRMNWISNARRGDMIVALKEMVAQLEGRASPKGHA